MANEPTKKPDSVEGNVAAAILKLAENLGAQQERQNDAIEALRASQPPREVQFGDPDYQAKLRAERKVLKRPAFQNGFEVNPSGLSDEVIDRLANLAPGAYLGGRVRVAIENDAVHLIYKNREIEHRMANDRLFSSFSDLVNKIWAEMPKQTAAA